MSFYSVWQPLGERRMEDARTALVFGFLRHADANAVLRPYVRRSPFLALKVIDSSMVSVSPDVDREGGGDRSGRGS
ncbi:MAG: hypothetical protein JO262_20695 [Solirubrobacterales bacterium]|nr:hypothetical protein [Solirubrobacterales bacterium]